MVVDYYGAPARQRTRPWLIGIPVVFLLFLTANGELHATGLRVASGVALALIPAPAVVRPMCARRSPRESRRWTDGAS